MGFRVLRDLSCLRRKGVRIIFQLKIYLKFSRDSEVFARVLFSNIFFAKFLTLKYLILRKLCLDFSNLNQSLSFLYILILLFQFQGYLIIKNFKFFFVIAVFFCKFKLPKFFSNLKQKKILFNNSS